MPALAVTTEEMIAEVRASIAEPSEGYITDAEITRWINFALLDIVTRARILTSDAKTGSVAAQKKYGLPSDFMLVEKVFFQNLELVPLDIHQLLTVSDHTGLDQQSATPEHYYIRGAQDSPLCLFLWKVPTTTIADAIHLFYIAKPDAMIAGSTFPLSSEWAYAAALWATARAHRKQRQLADSRLCLGEYETIVAEAESRRNMGHQVDRPLEMNDSRVWDRNRYPRTW
jgi:hypothetical protein